MNKISLRELKNARKIYKAKPFGERNKIIKQEFDKRIEHLQEAHMAKALAISLGREKQHQKIIAKKNKGVKIAAS